MNAITSQSKPPPFEIRLAAAVAVAEAGGEQDPRSIPAVCEVIRNRVGMHASWKDVQDVVTAPYQFSCLLQVRDLNEFVAEQACHPRYQEAIQALLDTETSYTNGATHYCRVEINPYWTEGVTPTATIQHHKFFKVA